MEGSSQSTGSGRGSHGAPPTFDDWHAIHTLIMTYADLVDSGRFAEAAAMFEHATYGRTGDSHTGAESYRGTTEVKAYMDRTRLFPDGTPRTKHVNTNVLIEFDGNTARSRCYVTVFQQTDTLPLQPVAAGRYVDRFERVGGIWRWADRLITGFLLGNTSEHKDPAQR